MSTAPEQSKCRLWYSAWTWQDDLKNRMNSSYKESILSPRQQWRPLPSLLYLSFFLWVVRTHILGLMHGVGLYVGAVDGSVSSTTTKYGTGRHGFTRPSPPPAGYDSTTKVLIWNIKSLIDTWAGRKEKKSKCFMFPTVKKIQFCHIFAKTEFFLTTFLPGSFCLIV